MSSSLKSILGKWLGTPSPAAPAKSLNRMPEPGDVVRMALPGADNPNRPGAHLQCGIVINARTSPGGTLTLQVVPAEPLYAGRLARSHASTFNMADEAAAKAAGLPHTASFDLKKTVTVDWSQKYGAATGQRPLVGRLQDKDYDRFLYVYRAWRIAQNETRNREQAAQSAALKPVAYSPEIAKAIRNKGKTEEVWIRSAPGLV